YTKPAIDEPAAVDDPGFAEQNDAEELPGPRCVHGNADDIHGRWLSSRFCSTHAAGSVSGCAKTAVASGPGLRFCRADQAEVATSYETVGNEVGKSAAGRGSCRLTGGI